MVSIIQGSGIYIVVILPAVSGFGPCEVVSPPVSVAFTVPPWL